MTRPSGDTPVVERERLDERDADILLDQFANAVYMHREDESPKDGVAQCNVCGRVRARIKELLTR